MHVMCTEPAHEMQASNCAASHPLMRCHVSDVSESPAVNAAFSWPVSSQYCCAHMLMLHKIAMQAEGEDDILMSASVGRGESLGAISRGTSMDSLEVRTGGLLGTHSSEVPAYQPGSCKSHALQAAMTVLQMPDMCCITEGAWCMVFPAPCIDDRHLVYFCVCCTIHFHLWTNTFFLGSGGDLASHLCRC